MMVLNSRRGKALAKGIGGLFAVIAIIFVVDRCTRVETITHDDSMFREIAENRKAREAAADRAVEVERAQARALRGERAKEFAGITGPLKPKDSPGRWVPISAYPPAALKAAIEGTVHFTLSVDADGIPTDCEVTISSGNDELDAATCHNLMKRAMFHPAIKNGKAVPSSYSSRVRWTHPYF